MTVGNYFFKEPQNEETKIKKADVKAQEKAQWGFSYTQKKQNVIVIKTTGSVVRLPRIHCCILSLTSHVTLEKLKLV